MYRHESISDSGITGATHEGAEIVKVEYFFQRAAPVMAGFQNQAQTIGAGFERRAARDAAHAVTLAGREAGGGGPSGRAEPRGWAGVRG